MRITIDVSGGSEPGAQEAAVSTSASPSSAYETATPPQDVAARAAAERAISGGPAPAEAMAEGPAVFTSNQLGTDEAMATGAPRAASGESAGAAPDFLTGVRPQEIQLEADA